MARQPRDTYTYDLKRGGRVVYKGTTNDPERREREHRREGKVFDKLEPTSPPMTRGDAKEKEVKNLETYRRNHGGRNPPYNEDKDG